MLAHALCRSERPAGMKVGAVSGIIHCRGSRHDQPVKFNPTVTTVHYNTETLFRIEEKKMKMNYFQKPRTVSYEIR